MALSTLDQKFFEPSSCGGSFKVNIILRSRYSAYLLELGVIATISSQMEVFSTVNSRSLSSPFLSHSFSLSLGHSLIVSLGIDDINDYTFHSRFTFHSQR